MSQQYTCITKTKSYGPPCFLDGDDQPACEYKVTECGVNLKGIPRNAETERLFQAASLTGHAEVLSDEDISNYVGHKAYQGEEILDCFSRVRGNIQRFRDDAEALLTKFRKE